MRWIFDLTVADEAAVAKVNFQLADGEVLLHLDYRRFRGALVVNQRKGGVWQTEAQLPVSGEAPPTLRVLVDAASDGTVSVLGPAGRLAVAWASARDIEAARLWLEGGAARRDTEAEAEALLRSWRVASGRSGFPAPSARLARLRAGGDFARGLSFVVPAHNEARLAAFCIEGLAGLGDEIVFADCASTDATGPAADRLRARVFELRTFRASRELPKPGPAHAREVFAGGTNTEAHLLNWCLGQSTAANAVLWPASFLALRANLAEMIAALNLRTREDNFALWFSGHEIFTDGERFWVNRAAARGEFRAFSLRHGHEWVNLPTRAEPDQGALYRAQKLYWPKPVWLDIVRLDEAEFRERGFDETAPAARERLAIIAAFRDKGTMPGHLAPVASLRDPAIAAMALPEAETTRRRTFEERYRSRPKLTQRASGTVYPAGAERQDELAVLVHSAPRATERQDTIRRTWGADLDRLGIPWVFVVGRPAQPTQIVGDTLFVNAPDSHEFRAARALAAFEFSLAAMNVDHVLRLEDDCVLDAFALIRADLSGRDFVGGAEAAGGVAADRHLGHCRNPQLDDVMAEREAGFRWVDGRSGLALSRTARLMLQKERGRIRTALEEDYIVARVLALHGIEVSWPFGAFRAADFGTSWRGAADICLVTGIPDAETMALVHADLVGPEAAERAEAAFGESFEVGWDWLDMEAARLRLGV